MKKPYNTTDLDPMLAAERGIIHRDMIGHVFRWTHIVKNAKIGETIVDFGSGKGRLLEIMWRNRYKPKKYIGLDIREKTIEKAREEYSKAPFDHEFICQDLIKPTINLKKLNADKVVSLEVAEHIGKNNIQAFLKHFKDCGSEDAIYYLSTPNYDEDTGAAQNHIFDSGDGRGVAVQEFTYDEMFEALDDAGFEIVNSFGTFASQRDYKLDLEDWQIKTFEALKKYYDSNLVANIMAPILESSYARNIMWVLKRYENEGFYNE